MSAEQLPLDLGHGVAQGRDDLIVAEPLAAALAIVDRWPDWNAPAVVLCGPAGSGKSHLANIWRERSDAVSLVPQSDAAPDYDALAGRHVLVEDPDRLALNEQSLFHLFNLMRQQNTTMLLTGRTPPAAWPISLADLKSRLAATTVVAIGEPDDALLTRILFKLFADRQIVVDQRVVAYLVARMERSLDFAARLVAEMDRLALAKRARMTTAVAADALARLSSEAESDAGGQSH